MSCSTNGTKAAQAARASGVADGYQANQNEMARFYLPASQAALPWPPPGGSRRWLWRDYRRPIKAALKAWRSKKDDRRLVWLRAELAAEVAERAMEAKQKDHPAGVAGRLAEERARLLISPPKSITVGERVERIAILDNALALLRLKRAINEAEYRAALVDVVGQRQAAGKRSKVPVTWLPARPVGAETETASEVDPTRKIRVRYRVVALTEPVTSHTLSGAINPDYDQNLQPRQRERTASRLQIEQMARNLAAGELLKGQAGWADGPPLVGPEGLVESGNGRLLALRRAIELNPEGYERYRRQLIEQAVSFGLDRAAVRRLKQPVLVRERLTELSDQARQRFVNEANASRVARPGVAEQARADARLIPPGVLADLRVSDSDRSLGQVLSKKSNGPVVARLLKLLPESERAALMDRQGRLSAAGLDRLERAIFAYALSGERLSRLVFEEGEAIDRVGAGLKRALPKLGQLEDLIRAGQRRPELSLGADLAVAVEKMRDLRQQGLSVNDYLRQYRMFPELTRLQEQWLAQLDERRRSARAVAELINAYTERGLRTAPPEQAGMFGPDTGREELFRAAVKAVDGSWVELNRWSVAQRVISGFDLPATWVERLSPAQQAKGMKLAARHKGSDRDERRSG